MKDNYFLPEANLIEYDYTNVVSASHDLPPAPTPTPNEKNHCDIPKTKNKDCGDTPKTKKSKC